MDEFFHATQHPLIAETHDQWLTRQAAQRNVADITALRGKELVQLAHDLYGPRLSVLSSFGTESVVLLSLVAAVDKNIRVFFIDTGKLFPETHAYKDTLVQSLGLTHVQTLRPNPLRVAVEDPEPPSDLWQRNRTVCCALRKDVPLKTALEHIAGTRAALQQFDQPLNDILQNLGDKVALLNGARRGHGRGRDQMENHVVAEGRVDFSPIFNYSDGEVAAVFAQSGLPPHPLASRYPSIGCDTPTCTTEKGRFMGEAAEDQVCGINIVDGKIVPAKRPGSPTTKIESLDSAAL